MSSNTVSQPRLRVVTLADQVAAARAGLIAQAVRLLGPQAATRLLRGEVVEIDVAPELVPAVKELLKQIQVWLKKRGPILRQGETVGGRDATV